MELDPDRLELEPPADDDVGGSVSRSSATWLALGITDQVQLAGFPSRPSSRGRIDSVLPPLPLPLPPAPLEVEPASSSDLR